MLEGEMCIDAGVARRQLLNLSRTTLTDTVHVYIHMTTLYDEVSRVVYLTCFVVVDVHASASRLRSLCDQTGRGCQIHPLTVSISKVLHPSTGPLNCSTLSTSHLTYKGDYGKQHFKSVF